MSKLIRELTDAGLKSARLDAESNVIAAVSDQELSQVSGGRVRTSDRQQKAVLDFVKG